MNNVNIDKDKVNNTTPSWVTPITDENIGKLKDQDFFILNSDDDRKRNTHYNKLIRRLMQLAQKVNGMETLILYDNMRFKCVAPAVTNYSYNEVALTLEMEKIMYMSNNTFTVFHNHPLGGDFSILDLRAFLARKNLQVMVMCTNSCMYSHMLIKTKNHENLFSSINRILSYLIKLRILTGHESAMTIIKRLEILGIGYERFQNY